MMNTTVESKFAPEPKNSDNSLNLHRLNERQRMMGIQEKGPIIPPHIVNPIIEKEQN